MKTQSHSHLEQDFFLKLRKKQAEVAYIPPQTLGVFTPYYQRVIPYFKSSPWKVIVIASMLATVFLRLALGVWFVRLASLLQHGF